MFRHLGNIVSRRWPWFLAAWIVLLAAGYLLAPPWQRVAQGGEFAFLPASSPSRRGEALLRQAFPGHVTTSSIVLVFHRQESPLTPQDHQFIDTVVLAGLRHIAQDEGGLAQDGGRGPVQADPGRQQSIITRIRTPSDRPVGALLRSADGKAALVVAELTTEFLEYRNWPTVARVERLVHRLYQEAKVPAGLEIDLTGSAVLGRDLTWAEKQSSEDIEFWTLVCVVVLLLLIYRAPLMALLPLLTVFFASQVALKLLALLAGAGIIGLFQGIQVFITVIGYGAGVDYCLFLIARYQEELDAGVPPAEAVAQAVAKVGAAVTASGGTVMCGIGMMAFAEFGKFHQAGIGVLVSLAVVLAAALTFTPALLRLTGTWAFWPQIPGAARAAVPGRLGSLRQWFTGLWDALGRALVRRPGTIWLASVLLMAPWAVAGVIYYNDLNYDLLSNLPGDVPSVNGQRVLQRHFPAGLTGPVTVLLHAPGIDLLGPRGLGDLDLPPALEFLDVWLEILAIAPGSGRKGIGVLQEMTRTLLQQRQELHLADVRSAAHPLGTTEAAAAAVAGRAPRLARWLIRRAALSHYISTAPGTDGEVTRLDLVLTVDPFTREGIRHLATVEQAVRAAVPAGIPPGFDVHVLGPTASLRDLKTVTDHDQDRIELLVLGGVYVILVILLRRPAISLYLIASVLLSYLATLGATMALFWALDPAGYAGLDWKVPLFLFAILIAVGEDYNIFLMTRIQEEQERHGKVEGVTVALSQTGRIISSCGFIMAGTFASLLAGSLLGMQQLGFALAFGVLLDTLVVRPILVPAYLILLYQGRLGRLGTLLSDERARPVPLSQGDADKGPRVAGSKSTTTTP